MDGGAGVVAGRSGARSRLGRTDMLAGHSLGRHTANKTNDVLVVIYARRACERTGGVRLWRALSARRGAPLLCSTATLQYLHRPAVQHARCRRLPMPIDRGVMADVGAFESAESAVE